MHFRRSLHCDEKLIPFAPAPPCLLIDLIDVPDACFVSLPLYQPDGSLGDFMVCIRHEDRLQITGYPFQEFPVGFSILNEGVGECLISSLCDQNRTRIPRHIAHKLSVGHLCILEGAVFLFTVELCRCCYTFRLKIIELPFISDAVCPDPPCK